ncbi:type II toxin-antitoxin system VapC family toxin [Salinarimonas chemoclinalis]|uniref:type II toxin-antitoxin system VapC family toxin n=1 Tax=Salinarimonas chemoclinalis TaxID=3241599 RepID=UPI003555D9BE
MRSDTARSIAERHDPARRTRSLAYRERGVLPFDAADVPQLPLLLDTTVYVDRLQGRLPPELAPLLTLRAIRHSSVACAELTITLGMLDPAHSGTPQVASAIANVLSTIDMSRTVEPSAEAFIEAGMLAGILARTQGLARPKKSLSPAERCCQEGRRRAVLNDALIYMSAIESESLLLSRNTRDLDLLQQLKPSWNLLLYDAVGARPRTSPGR